MTQSIFYGSCVVPFLPEHQVIEFLKQRATRIEEFIPGGRKIDSGSVFLQKFYLQKAFLEQAKSEFLSHRFLFLKKKKSMIKTMKTLNAGRKAFTLIELIVVISILVILVSLFLSKVQTSLFKAREVQCKENLRKLHHAVLFFATEKNSLPESFTDSFIEKETGVSPDKMKCPLCKGSFSGYRINQNLKTKLSSKGLENLNSENILIYETDSSSGITHSERHGGVSYAITVYGDFIDMKSDEKLKYIDFNGAREK